MKVKKLKLDELQISSFVTTDKVLAGGDTDNRSTTTTNSVRIHGSCKHGATRAAFCRTFLSCTCNRQETIIVNCNSETCTSNAQEMCQGTFLE